MNLDSLNKWLALGANLGVLVGIVFLVTEIDQANRIAQNESESNLNSAAAFLSANVREEADLMIKLMDESSVLTAEEKFLAEQLASEHMAVWGSANNAYRSGLIADYLWEIYMVAMEQTLNNYPGLALALSELYTPRWAGIVDGELELIDRVRGVLRAQGIQN